MPTEEALSSGQTMWSVVEDVRTARKCRVLVAGVGNPWLRDMDFGPQIIRKIRLLDWPDDVVIEDAAIAAHRVLHLLQETTPDRVVFVAGFPRGDPAGTIRRSIADIPMPEETEVQDRLGEAAGGVIDFDHTLIITKYFNALPADTIIIEVEAVDTAFGTGFSPEVEACVQPVIEMLRKETAR